MKNETFYQLALQRTGLLEELKSLTHMLHGSWVKRYSICSRKGCNCRLGKRHGPRHYVVVNIDSKQRQKYIPISQVHAAQKGIEQYRRAQEIIEEITHINLALIKKGAYK